MPRPATAAAMAESFVVVRIRGCMRCNRDLPASLKRHSDTGVTPEAVSRKLKELALFSGPGTLAMLDKYDNFKMTVYQTNSRNAKFTLADF